MRVIKSRQFKKTTSCAFDILTCVRIMANNNSSHLPKLIAFDLDGTVWKPDMYELWGGGAPFTKTSDPNVLLDTASSNVTLCGNIRNILTQIASSNFVDTKVCYVSCTDEPSWAEECLTKFCTDDGTTLADIVDKDINQIYKSNKKTHFQKIHALTGIEFKDMMFFDNEKHNCTSVSQLGVICIHCQNGMDKNVWSQALETFAASI